MNGSEINSAEEAETYDNSDDEHYTLENLHRSLGHWQADKDTHVSTEEEMLKSLFTACRTGDMREIERCLAFGIDINYLDQWNYSPLILASLCGHERVVKFLLENGAVCDENTQEGASNYSKATDKNQSYIAYISTLRDKSDSFCDISFQYTDEQNNQKLERRNSLEAHRFYLSARSPKVRNLLASEWQSDVVVGDKVSKKHSLKIALDTLYLRPMNHPVIDEDLKHLWKNMSFPPEYLDAAVKLTELKPGSKAWAEQRESLKDLQVSLAQADLLKFYGEEILGRKVSLQQHSGQLDGEMLKRLIDKSPYADVIIITDEEAGEYEEGNETCITYYPAQKAMLCRVEYFKTMLNSPLSSIGLEYVSESVKEVLQQTPHISILGCPFPAHITELVLEFIYTDRVNLPAACCLDVLRAAHLLMFDELITHAVAAITRLKTWEHWQDCSAFEILTAAWELNLIRLEAYAAELIAHDLQLYTVKGSILREEFAEFVLQSAKRIQERQETDTVELVDDIKYYLAKKYSVAYDRLVALQEGTQDMTPEEEAFMLDMNTLDDLLQELNLDL